MLSERLIRRVALSQFLCTANNPNNHSLNSVCFNTLDDEGEGAQRTEDGASHA